MQSPFSSYLTKKVKINPKHMDLVDAQISRKSISKGDVLLSAGEICQNILSYLKMKLQTSQ